MRSRTTREGAVGLLIIAGLGLIGALALWIRGVSVGRRGYQLVVEFPSVVGLQEGNPVRFRGVEVGQVENIRPSANGVDVSVTIYPEQLLIPRQSIVETSQEGLIGETTLDIIPETSLKPDIGDLAKPLEEDCNPELIVCSGSRLQGEPSPTVNDLIRASIQLSDLLSDPQLFGEVKAVVKNSAEAAAGLTELTQEIASLSGTIEQELSGISASAVTATNAAGRAADQVARVADQLQVTTQQVNDLLASNRQNLTQTLDNVQATSAEVRELVTSLAPVVDQVEQGEFLSNLETLSANAAQASTNLRDLSESLNSRENVFLLQQTLDSARVTFENVQKITADLDELTGDPAFRSDVRRLIDGLSQLVSSTQQLQQQGQMAQHLSPLSSAGSEQLSTELVVIPNWLISPGNSDVGEPSSNLPAD